jgi:hypothetical protein
VHHGRRTPVSVAAATSDVQPPVGDVFEEMVEDGVLDDGPGHIVRMKEHPAKPMTVDQALFEMELVGHDFFLFVDCDSDDKPTVVYRRHAYDYGLIRLSA